LNIRKAILGAVLIVLQATAVGLGVNALSPNPLPWIRVPPHMTRKVADSKMVLGSDTISATIKKTQTEPKSPDDKVAKSPDDKVDKVESESPQDIPAPVIERKEPPAVANAQKPSNVSGSSLRKVEKSKAASAVPKAKKVEALFTTLADAKALFDRKGAIFIDSRHREDYELERIPGAVWLFVEDVDRLYDGVLGSIPKDRTLITYCSDPQCGSAIKLADELVARGHTKVFILLEGLPGWKEAGYPTEGSSVGD